MISHAGNANFTGIQKKVCPHEYHGNIQYEKSVRIWSYFDPHFTNHISPHSVRMRANVDQDNSECRNFSRSDY